jgi:NADH:ubiquinone reductase (H+-translocating)
MSESTQQPHIVVIGAGFGGLTFCKDFPAGRARITVIDRTNHHLFQPLLYQVATAGLSIPDIAQPIRSILSDRSDITVLLDEVQSVDLEKRVVQGLNGPIHYDHLVVAVGARTGYFGRPDWEQFAPGLKTIDDAVRLRRQILLAIEQAELTKDEAERKRLMTAVVVGGGPTGVELAGALAELYRHTLVDDFRRIDPHLGRVILVEAGPRILGTFPPESSETGLQQLEELGVEVRLGTRVVDIREGVVELVGETIESANILWGAGVNAAPLAAVFGVETDRAGRLKVRPDLSLPGHPEVFAIGDVVSLVDPKGQVVPGVAPAAMQMGKHVAQTLAAEIAGQRKPDRREAFVYLDKGSMATVGRSKAVAVFAGIQMSGFIAWMAWLLVHLLFVVGLRGKVSVVLSWAYSWFTYNRSSRVIYGTDPKPR